MGCRQVRETWWTAPGTRLAYVHSERRVDDLSPQVVARRLLFVRLLTLVVVLASAEAPFRRGRPPR